MTRHATTPPDQDLSSSLSFHPVIDSKTMKFSHNCERARASSKQAISFKLPLPPDTFNNHYTDTHPQRKQSITERAWESYRACINTINWMWSIKAYTFCCVCLLVSILRISINPKYYTNCTYPNDIDTLTHTHTLTMILFELKILFALYIERIIRTKSQNEYETYLYVGFRFFYVSQYSEYGYLSKKLYFLYLCLSSSLRLMFGMTCKYNIYTPRHVFNSIASKPSPTQTSTRQFTSYV